MTEQPRPTRRQLLTAAAGVGSGAVVAAALPASAHAVERHAPGTNDEQAPIPSYTDGRPVATTRWDARDTGPVLRHGDGPGRCDVYGARDVWVYEHGGTLYMNYDGAGDTGWLACLATSRDGRSWVKHGPVLDLGAAGAKDSGSASYGLTYRAGPRDWHMFYLGTPNTTPPPDRIPAFPYLTLKATAPGPAGPWTKQPDVVPFAPTPGTYYSVTASPGQVVRHGGQYLQFFSASTSDETGTHRGIGLARTTDLNGAWQPDPQPLIPLTQQVENTSLHYEASNDTWFLFTNHVALDAYGEYTDAIWVYWSHDLESWDTQNKAVILDRANCTWSPNVVGLPSVVPMGERLAVFYDARPAPDSSHMGRDIGLAWLDLPLVPPRPAAGRDLARGANVTASSTAAGYAASRTVDGRTSTEIGGEHSWCNDPAAAWPSWLELDLGRDRRLERVDLYLTSGYELRDYRVQTWNGRTWQDAVDVVGNHAAHRTHRLERAVVTSRVRVLCRNGPDRQPAYLRINEIELR